MFITIKIAFIFTSLSAVHIYDFHIFTVIYSKEYCLCIENNSGTEYDSDLRSNEHYFNSSEKKACAGFEPMTLAIPVQFFSGILFTTVKVVFITAKIAIIYTSLSAVQIWLSYIHSPNRSTLTSIEAQRAALESTYFSRNTFRTRMMQPVPEAMWRKLNFCNICSESSDPLPRLNVLLHNRSSLNA